MIHCSVIRPDSISAACQFGSADEDGGAALGDQPPGLFGTLESDHGEVFDDLGIEGAVDEEIGPGQGSCELTGDR